VIDFRYHLVSLVSVFLALAVGIALGAGPLKAPIDATIVSDVDSLRQKKSQLQDEIVRLQSSQKHRDDFVARVSPVLVGQRLGGRSVVVVTLPGTDSETVDQLGTVLEQAGARVTARIAVAKEWSAPDKAAFREQLATQLQAGLGGGEVGGQTPQRLATLLARAVVTGDLAAGKLDATARTTVEGLASGDLIAVDGDLETRATEAVLVAPPLPETEDASPGSTPATAETDTRIWQALAAALDTESDGTVVLGPPSSAGDGGLLKVLREDTTLERAVSTVDTAGTPMGSVTTVLALSEQLRGGAGAYGYADGADKVLPQLAGTAAEN
jgi:hypothetical protein